MSKLGDPTGAGVRPGCLGAGFGLSSGVTRRPILGEVKQPKPGGWACALNCNSHKCAVPTGKRRRSHVDVTLPLHRCSGTSVLSGPAGQLPDTTSRGGNASWTVSGEEMAFRICCVCPGFGEDIWSLIGSSMCQHFYDTVNSAQLVAYVARCRQKAMSIKEIRSALDDCLYSVDLDEFSDSGEGSDEEAVAVEKVYSNEERRTCMHPNHAGGRRMKVLANAKTCYCRKCSALPAPLSPTRSPVKKCSKPAVASPAASPMPTAAAGSCDNDSEPAAASPCHKQLYPAASDSDEEMIGGGGGEGNGDSDFDSDSDVDSSSESDDESDMNTDSDLDFSDDNETASDDEMEVVDAAAGSTVMMHSGGSSHSDSDGSSDSDEESSDGNSSTPMCAPAGAFQMTYNVRPAGRNKQLMIAISSKDGNPVKRCRNKDAFLATVLKVDRFVRSWMTGKSEGQIDREMLSFIFSKFDHAVASDWLVELVGRPLTRTLSTGEAAPHYSGKTVRTFRRLMHAVRLLDTESNRYAVSVTDNTHVAERKQRPDRRLRYSDKKKVAHDVLSESAKVDRKNNIYDFWLNFRSGNAYDQSARAMLVPAEPPAAGVKGRNKPRGTQPRLSYGERKPRSMKSSRAVRQETLEALIGLGMDDKAGMKTMSRFFPQKSRHGKGASPHARHTS